VKSDSALGHWGEVVTGRCRLAGADEKPIPGWTQEGRRRANAVRPSFGTPGGSGRGITRRAGRLVLVILQMINALRITRAVLPVRIRGSRTDSREIALTALTALGLPGDPVHPRPCSRPSCYCA
jgi:hypothetical protein